jgi:hypothetical protein
LTANLSKLKTQQAIELSLGAANQHTQRLEQLPRQYVQIEQVLPNRSFQQPIETQGGDLGHNVDGISLQIVKTDDIILLVTHHCPPFSTQDYSVAITRVEEQNIWEYKYLLNLQLKCRNEFLNLKARSRW